MRIKTIKEAEAVRDLIGDQNVEACRKALVDGAQVWFFRDVEEIENDSDLTKKEKKECKRILREEKLGYAGWVRSPQKKSKPTSQQILLGVPSYDYDSHGNYRGGGGGNVGSIH